LGIEIRPSHVPNKVLPKNNKRNNYIKNYVSMFNKFDLLWKAYNDSLKTINFNEINKNIYDYYCKLYIFNINDFLFIFNCNSFFILIDVYIFDNEILSFLYKKTIKKNTDFWTLMNIYIQNNELYIHLCNELNENKKYYYYVKIYM